MNPYKVSAQFAAHSWFMSRNGNKPTAAEAMEFARDNWAAFLPCAHKGLGRLLIRIARPKPNRYGSKPVRTATCETKLENAIAG